MRKDCENARRPQYEKPVRYDSANKFLCCLWSAHIQDITYDESSLHQENKRIELTAGDSSSRMTAPRVSTWITRAVGNAGVFADMVGD